MDLSGGENNGCVPSKNRKLEGNCKVATYRFTASSTFHPDAFSCCSNLLASSIRNVHADINTSMLKDSFTK